MVSGGKFGEVCGIEEGGINDDDIIAGASLLPAEASFEASAGHRLGKK